jgi:thymidylate synthase
MNLEVEYKGLLLDAWHNGTKRHDRTGVGCRSIFSPSLSWDLTSTFPIITGRAIYPKVFNTEFLWFINGETNIKRFQDAGVKIWDAWSNENGDLGPVYGHQMLNFNNEAINQLEAVKHSLKHNRDSRRHIISLWNPAQLSEMALPPCYHNFQFFVDDNTLNMHVLQRSGDLFLGIPSDIALFSMLLLHVSKECLYLPGVIKLTIVDAHVYENQFEAIDEYIKQPIRERPKYTFKDNQINLIEYKQGKKITAKVAV